MRTRFRTFRRSRPFWGGLWITAGGIIMALLPLGPLTDVIRAGLGAVGGVLLGLLLTALGVLVLINPGQRKLGGLCAVIVGLVSYPVTNFGGFFICMFLALLGGSMAFAWTPDKNRAADRVSAVVPEPLPSPDVSVVPEGS